MGRSTNTHGEGYLGTVFKGNAFSIGMAPKREYCEPTIALSALTAPITKVRLGGSMLFPQTLTLREYKCGKMKALDRIVKPKKKSSSMI